MRIQPSKKRKLNFGEKLFDLDWAQHTKMDYAQNLRKGLITAKIMTYRNFLHYTIGCARDKYCSAESIQNLSSPILSTFLVQKDSTSEKQNKMLVCGPSAYNCEQGHM